MPRLNILEDLPSINNVTIAGLLGVGSLHVSQVNFPGSISFNTLAVIMSRAASNIGRTLSVSFGLYSLNASTLSLANSASFSETLTAGGLSWYTLATSATQDITPGSWFFGLMSSTSGNSQFSLVLRRQAQEVRDGTYGGPFILGYMSVSTSALPSSIATSDMSKEGGSNVAHAHPYILISA